MYEKRSKSPVMSNLPMFFDGTLNVNNRWVKLAAIVPWDDVDKIYSENFKSDRGPKALPSRVALGALIIQIKLNLTDEETVNQIAENPYLQYFIGLDEFQYKDPFDSSMMTHFRQRLNMSDVKDINDLIHTNSTRKAQSKDDDNDIPPVGGESPEENKGQLIVDASCAPADVHYPTDLGLLNKAREKSEQIVDTLWKFRSNKDLKVKPRTYRKAGRKSFLEIIKQKRPGRNKIRSAIRFQLNCLRRNLSSIEFLKEHSELINLGRKLYKDLLVINTLYAQQLEMYENKKHSVNDRIVSISQPHVRPIVRGKAAAKTEFGAKISISVVDGWSFIDTISFDSYNEGQELQQQIEQYKERFGYYPKSVHADKIYRNLSNRKYCKNRGIRLSGPKLGRRIQDKEKLQAQKEQEYADEGVRNQVEGRFGVAKRRYGLDKIMTKLKGTSETVIAMIFLVMNLDMIVHFLFQNLDALTTLYKKIAKAVLRDQKTTEEKLLNAMCKAS